MLIREYVQQRNISIDRAKGLLIMLVVLGHVVSAFDVNYNMNIVFKFCYSFHMFLFMYISGYLLGTKNNNYQWLKHRFKRLMIPFFIWSIILLIYTGTSINIINIIHLFTFPMLWYLIVLFCCDVLLSICCMLKGKIYNMICATVMFIFLNLLSLYPQYVCDAVKAVAIYFPFYYVGWYARRYNLTLSWSIMKISVVCYLISMVFYGYKDRSIQSGYIMDIISILDVAPNIINMIGKSFIGVLGVLYNHFFVAPLGAVFGWWLVKQLEKIFFIEHILSSLGKYTLPIYIMSGFFQITVFDNIMTKMAISFILGLVGPIFIGCIIEKKPKLNRILFGV